MPKVAVLTRAFFYTCVALVVMQVATAQGVAAEPLAQQCAYAPQTGSINSREAIQQGDSPLTWQQARQWFNAQGGS
jgi:hypothetical protein